LRRKDASFHLRQRELGIFTGYDQIAIQYHLDSATIRTAIDGSDYRFRRGVSPGERAKPVHRRGDAFGLGLDTGLLVGVPAGAGSLVSYQLRVTELKDSETNQREEKGDEGS
jgi:hypothetical protein